MTAAIGAEVAAGAEGAGAGAGAEGASAGATRASRVAPTGSAPVGSAPSSAGSPGTSARTQRQLKPKTSGASTGSSRSSRGSKSSSRSKSSGPALPFTSGGKSKVWAPGKRGGRVQRLIVGEFLLCLVIVAFSPLTDKHKAEPPQAVVKRLTAIAAMFLLLALLSTAGRGASRVAAAFGGLVTVALLVSDRDIFSVIAARFKAPAPAGPAGPPDEGTETTNVPPAAGRQFVGAQVPNNLLPNGNPINPIQTGPQVVR